VTTETLLLLLKVYEAKGKSSYYDELFERDKDVFLKKTIEKNVYYFGKLMDLGLTDARLKLLSKKKLIAKNKKETFLLNIKGALTSIQKHPDQFELFTNEFDNLAKALSKNYETIKFESKEKKNDGTIFTATAKSKDKREDLDAIIMEYNKQNKTNLYELT